MARKNIYVINYQYLDQTGTKLSIGGVEKYIYNLCQVMTELDIKTEIYQISKEPFEREYNGVIVHGLMVKENTFVKTALSCIPENEIVIFANDEIVYGKYNGTTINLQHGIGWDYQKHQYRGELFEKIYRILALRDDRRRIKYSKQADYVVCVDYNYVNWFRTQVNYSNTNFKVIPNFTKTLSTYPEKPVEIINMIFARRFTGYRGTRIFTEAVKELLATYPNLYVTYAGTGPDEDWIKDQLFDQERVLFTSYSGDESLIIHADKHIAVIPSIGSEGTSLSLLEAMASGCVVICTNVGGMTNIVLDHYNGILVNPDTKSLVKAIKEVIDNPELRDLLSKKAYETATIAFSRDKWAESWKQLLQEILM